MKRIQFGKIIAGVGLLLAACATPPTGATNPTSDDQCGASKYQSLVGGPSKGAWSLTDIPDDSRHYGSEESIATNVPTRLNFIHSGTAIESVTNPNSKVVRVFCG